jgi:hypothetical protein
MGSQFMSLRVADPEILKARLRGDFPDIVDALYKNPKPPEIKLRPAFELMARGTFVFLPKGREHPDGLMVCRAFEYLLETLGQRRWNIEFYPDESEDAMWTLAFGRCEAAWLDLPATETGIGTTAWKSPDTCRSLRGSLQRALQTKSYNPRYSPQSSIEECIQALDEAISSRYGLFTIFQG